MSRDQKPSISSSHGATSPEAGDPRSGSDTDAPTVSGRVVMMHAQQIPSHLRLGCSALKPPFTFQSALTDQETVSFACKNQQELDKAMGRPTTAPDRNGAFMLKDIPRKARYLHVLHPFYRTTEPVPLFNSSSSGLVAVLEEAGVIEGQLLDSKGAPAVSATVMLKEEFNPYLAYSDRKGRFIPFSTKTDETGGFRVEQVPAGHLFVLEASLPGHAPVQVKPVIARKGDTLRLRVTLDAAASIAGKVLDGSGAPAREVQVGLIKVKTRHAESYGEPLARQDTGIHGDFLFPDLAAGQYKVRLFEDGFMRKATEAVHLESGCFVDHCRLELERGRSISGIAVDHDGEPLAGTRIEAVIDMDVSNWANFVSDQENPLACTTDGAGRFQLWGLEEGSYDLKLQSACGTLTRTVQAAAGDRDLRIILRQGGTLSGKVTIANMDQPVESFHILLLQNPSSSSFAMFNPIRDSKRSRHAFKSESGEFVLADLLPGTYDLSFSAEGFSTARLEGVELDFEERIDGFSVELPRASNVSGYILDPVTGDPIAGAMISRESGFSGMLQAVLSEEVAYSDSLGCFNFKSLPPGVIRLVSTHPDYLEASVEAIVLQEGESIKGVEIQMQRGGTIRGRITKGQGARTPVAAVHIILSNMSGHRVKTALTDAGGFYRISGLGAGPYVVRKMPKEVILDDEGFMGSRLSDLMVRTVMVESDQVVVCNFNEGAEGEKGIDLYGTIMEQGKPVSKTIVSLLTADPVKKTFKPKTTSTDRDGNYRLEGISPGMYTLRIVNVEKLRTGGSSEIVQRLTVPDHAESGMRHDLSLPTGSLAGVVIDDRTKLPLEQIRIVVERCGAGRCFDPLSRAKGHRVGEAYTQSGGVFCVSNLSAGTYRVRAGGGNLVGMNSNGYGIRYTEEITIDADQTLSDVRIPLVKGGAIRGRITDRLGHAVTSASIHIQLPDQNRIEPFSECVSDGTGFFRYVGLNPGTYHVVVKHNDYALKTRYQVQVRQNEESELDVELDKGTAVYMDSAGRRPPENFMEPDVEWLDAEGRNLHGLSSFVDVMSRFMGGGGLDESHYFIGRFSPGEYTLKMKNPRQGTVEVKVSLIPGESARVVKLNPDS